MPCRASSPAIALLIVCISATLSIAMAAGREESATPLRSATPDHSQTADAPLTPQGIIQIAVPLPLTGPRRTVADAVRQRLTLLETAINAQGGILGRPLSLEFHDDTCTRDGARSLAETLAVSSPAPAAIIGHPCPTAAITAAPVYTRAGLLFLAAGVRHADFNARRLGPHVFRAAGRDDRQGSDAGQRLRELAGPTGTMLIVHDRTILARTLALAAQKSATRPDGAKPDILTIVAAENEYAKTVDAIGARKPDAVLFAGFPTEGAILLRELRQHGLGMPILFNEAMATAELADHVAPLLDAKVEVMMPVSINRDTLEEREPADALTASDSAAALMLWRDAVTATASIEAGRIAERLSASRQHLEEIAFDGTGDAVAPSFAPYRWNNGLWKRASRDNARQEPLGSSPDQAAPNRN